LIVDKPPKDAVSKIALEMKFTPTSKNTTQYVCRGFDLGSKSRRVVQIDPVVAPGSEHMVHHTLLHVCGAKITNETNVLLTHPPGGPAGKCLDPIFKSEYGFSPMAVQECTTLMFAWAAGGGSLVLPESAGFPIGDDSVRYVVLEVHYSHPTAIKDKSGVILHVTKDRSSRKDDATCLMIGDIWSYMPTIQQGAVEHREAVCPGDCTGQFTGDVSVFASFLHMHSHGRKIWTIKSNEEKKEITNRIDFWNFGFQQLTLVNFTLSPGDRLNTHAIFDTTKASKDIRFGAASDDEMLLDFLFVYPASRLNEIYQCGWTPWATRCGRGWLAPQEGDGTTDLPETFGSASGMENCSDDVISDKPICHKGKILSNRQK